MEEFVRFFQAKFHINSNGDVLKANGHKTTAEDVFHEYRNMREKAFASVDLTLDDVSKYIADNKPAAVASDADEFNLRQFIMAYLETYANPSKQDTRKWRIGPAWKSIERVGAGVPVPSDISQLQVAIRAYALDKGINKGAKLEDIKVILSDMAMNANENRVAKVVKMIKFNPECISVADEAIDKLHEFWMVKQSKEIFRTLIRHWMWQVKHKLLDLPTVWSIWINLFGGAAIGKTGFCEALSEPFGDFALSTSISKLLDEERQMQKLTGAYIINLDELSINNREGMYSERENTLGRDQQATLKALLTQTKMTTRVMGGQSQTTRRLTFSCISSANEHLYDIIYDEKTMRRYYEFDCMVEKVTDFSVMDEIKTHILDIWRSVDESLDDGYWNPKCSVWDETRAEQDKYYPTNTTTGLWINDMHVVACTKADSETESLYDEYKSYCKERGHMPKSQTRWITDIRHLVTGANESAHTFIRIDAKE